MSISLFFHYFLLIATCYIAFRVFRYVEGFIKGFLHCKMAADIRKIIKDAIYEENSKKAIDDIINMEYKYASRSIEDWTYCIGEKQSNFSRKYDGRSCIRYYYWKKCQHYVMLRDMNNETDSLSIIQSWLYNNMSKRFISPKNVGGFTSDSYKHTIVFFESQEDAVAFKLKWG